MVARVEGQQRGGRGCWCFPVTQPRSGNVGGVGTCWFLGALKFFGFCVSNTVRAPRKELPNPEDVPAGKQGDPARVSVEQGGQAGMSQVHLAPPEVVLGLQILVGERETCDMQPAEPLQTSSGRKMNLPTRPRQQDHGNG